MKQIPITMFPFEALLIAGRSIGGPEPQRGNELLCLDHVMARRFSGSEALPSFVLELNIPSKTLCSRQTTSPHCCSSQGLCLSRLHSDQKFWAVFLTPRGGCRAKAPWHRIYMLYICFHVMVTKRHMLLSLVLL